MSGRCSKICEIERCKTRKPKTGKLDTVVKKKGQILMKKRKNWSQPMGAAMLSVCAVIGLMGAAVVSPPTSTADVATYMPIATSTVHGATRTIGYAAPQIVQQSNIRAHVAHPVMARDTVQRQAAQMPTWDYTEEPIQAPVKSVRSFQDRLNLSVVMFAIATGCIETYRFFFGGKDHAMAAHTGSKTARYATEADEEIGTPDSLQAEMDAKAQQIADLKAQERFMKLGTGNYQCQDCTYTYLPKNGDPEYPVSAGTAFGNLPEDWMCPVCGAPKTKFQTDGVEVAGFEVNKGYGLGTNTMTGGQKSLLIYGALIAFFALFISGYALE